MLRLLLPFCFLSEVVLAQSAAVPSGDKAVSLQEQYLAMKTKAETYQDYKVIKEYVLDGTWQIMMDSLKERKQMYRAEQKTVAELKAELATVQQTLSRERGASAAVVHDSTHITVLGIAFTKSAFLISVAAIIVGLLFTGSILLTRMRLLQSTANEKVLIADLVGKEFEDYKHRALEKQTKLARELQTERNKLEELKLR